MSTEKVLLGALAGFATGALLGVFFAPYKGKELRQKISDQSRDYANDLKNKFSSYVDSLNEKYESMKDEAGYLADQGKATLDHAKKDIKSNAQKSGLSSSGSSTY